MFGACFDSSSNGHGSAFTADELLFLEFLALSIISINISGIFAVLHSSEIRILALEALVIRQTMGGKPLQVIIIWTLGVFESIALVQVFELSSLHYLFVD